MWPPRQARPVPKIGSAWKGTAIRLLAMSLGGWVETGGRLAGTAILESSIAQP